ncbi:hypothetical protein TgHK011_004185 [Trichoderma gracile]|nr:hypothetical protein TgHK011_004185 [Trichoderma gracile]
MPHYNGCWGSPSLAPLASLQRRHPSVGPWTRHSVLVLAQVQVASSQGDPTSQHVCLLLLRRTFTSFPIGWRETRDKKEDGVEEQTVGAVTCAGRVTQSIW